MSRNDKETLSALLDNEADELELRRLLKSYGTNSGIAESWERYSLVQALLHENAVPVNANFNQNIQQQIAMEAPLKRQHFPGWQQNLTKIAIAASVAAVFLFTVRSNLNSVPTPELANQDQLPSLQSSVPKSSLVAENVSFEVDPQAQLLLQQYINRIEIDEAEPPHVDHIQDSPLYRLVNELQTREEQQ